MSISPSRSPLVLGRWLIVASLALAPSVGSAQATKGAKPATVAEARKTLDLEALPLAPGAEAPGRRTLAGLDYQAPGTFKTVYDFHAAQLRKAGWKQAPGAYVTEQYASALYEKAGSRVSLAILPADKPNLVNVTLTQHGNVALAALPVPPDTKLSYSGPASIMYESPLPLADAKKAVRDGLVRVGWEPYGEAGDSQFLKQNALRLTATVQSAPAKAGKTVITYGTELMSFDLPAPPEATGLQYSDGTQALSFEFAGEPDALFGFYRDRLGKAGWTVTTDQPIKDGPTQTLIFRNESKDLRLIEARQLESGWRVSVRHQTAAQVEAERQRAEAAIAARDAKNKPAQPAAAVTLTPPAGAQVTKSTSTELTFTVAGGKAQPLVKQWQKELTGAGWKEDAAVLEGMAGSLVLSRDKARLSVLYTDTGFLPAEVSVTLTGTTFAGEKTGK